MYVPRPGSATATAGGQGYMICVQSEITLYSRAVLYICMCRGPAATATAGQRSNRPSGVQADSHTLASLVFSTNGMQLECRDSPRICQKVEVLSN